MFTKLPHPFGLLPLPPVHPNCRLIVTIPAKDEAAFLARTLDALFRQRRMNGSPLPLSTYEVIVLANNCADDTANVIRRYAARNSTFRLHVAEQTFSPQLACVGTARRLMMDTAYHRFATIRRPDGLICSTDADTLVAPDWVAQNLRAVAHGAQAVGGRILVPDEEQRMAGCRKQHLQDVTYRSLQYCLESMIDPCDGDPWPRHFQHFGPSTAVTAEAYAKCGGIPPLRCLEDVGLAAALERADVAITHCRGVQVRTSSRISHRVEGTAFSHQLDEWEQLEQRRGTQRVVGLQNCTRLFKWKVALRNAFRRRRPRLDERLHNLAAELGWSGDRLLTHIEDAPTFGVLYQYIREQLERHPQFADVPIGVAILELRRFTRSKRTASLSA